MKRYPWGQKLTRLIDHETQQPTVHYAPDPVLTESRSQALKELLRKDFDATNAGTYARCERVPADDWHLFSTAWAHGALIGAGAGLVAGMLLSGALIWLRF